MEIDKIEHGYYGWMLGADFPLHTKQCLKKSMREMKSKIAEKDQEKFESKLDQLKSKFK